MAKEEVGAKLTKEQTRKKRGGDLSYFFYQNVTVLGEAPWLESARDRVVKRGGTLGEEAAVHR